MADKKKAPAKKDASAKKKAPVKRGILGTGMAEKARQTLKNRQKAIDKKLKAAGA